MNYQKLKSNEDYKANLLSLCVLLIMVSAIAIAGMSYGRVAEADEEVDDSKSINIEDRIELMKSENYISVNSHDDMGLLSEEPEEDIDGFVHREEIPLSEKLQRFIYEESLKYEIPDTLVYAIMYVESRFDPNAKSHTRDSGLLQINKTTEQFIAKELGYETYDIYDPKTNIEFGLWYLGSLKEAWSAADISEEDKAYLVVGSFHRGVSGMKRYVKKHGYNLKYTDMVFEYKNLLEESDQNR